MNSQEVIRVAIIIAFLVQSLAIVLTVALVGFIARDFRKLVSYWHDYLSAVAEHSALTDRTARHLTERIERTVRDAQSDTVAEMSELLVASGTFHPPHLPGTPANPAAVVELPADPAPPSRPRPPDSVRHLPALIAALMVVGVSAPAAIQPPTRDQPVSIESGKNALRHGDYVKAETMFARAGDELGQAEALIDQKRYDEACLICERYPQDGRAKLYLGLIARAKGDAGGAFILLKEAEGLGSKEARDLLAWEART